MGMSTYKSRSKNLYMIIGMGIGFTALISLLGIGYYRSGVYMGETIKAIKEYTKCTSKNFEEFYGSGLSSADILNKSFAVIGGGGSKVKISVGLDNKKPEDGVQKDLDRILTKDFNSIKKENGNDDVKEYVKHLNNIVDEKKKVEGGSESDLNIILIKVESSIDKKAPTYGFTIFKRSFAKLLSFSDNVIKILNLEKDEDPLTILIFSYKSEENSKQMVVKSIVYETGENKTPTENVETFTVDNNNKEGLSYHDLLN